MERELAARREEVVFSLTVEAAAAVEPAGAGSSPTAAPRPLDAHHRMLHEAAVLSSHLSGYAAAVEAYRGASARFFAAAADFLASAGNPAAYEHRLTAEGAAAAAGAAAAVAAQAAGEGAASAAAGRGAGDGGAFEAPAAEPGLSLPVPIAGPAAGLALCPAAPGTPVLGAVGLTAAAPADVLLPAQHKALFRHDQQRQLVASAGGELAAALADRLLPQLERWAAVYAECKALLPEVERLLRGADDARRALEEARAQVIEAESASPLVGRELLEAAGAEPRVLVQAAAGGRLVAVPAGDKRREMYEADKEETAASLAFELAEKALRDKLGWLMTSGSGLKAAVAAALASALCSAAAEAQPGSAAGGPAAVALRAPTEELLEPFPDHVLARLRGEHQPTLPEAVWADQQRIRRWAARFREAVAATAAAAATAAGAQMLAATAAAHAGAARPEPLPATLTPQGGMKELQRTDQPVAPGPAAAPLSPPPPPPRASASASATGALSAQLQAAAEASGLPVDLLAAAVEADIGELEAPATAAVRTQLAWHLLHDASVVLGKEAAVLLPAAQEHAGAEAAGSLTDSHRRLLAALSTMAATEPAASSFDLAALEVVELLERHGEVLQQAVLPALAAAPGLTPAALRRLAGQYRRAAGAAPSRPHAWLMAPPPAGAEEQGAAAAAVAAAAAAFRRLLAPPARAGAALADAAADLARFGPGLLPAKV